MEKKKESGGGFFLVLAAKAAKLVKLVKLVKFTKIFLTLGSMAVSVFAYSFFRSPAFAVGFVLLLFIHEMGHVVALQMRGYPAKSPVFIPFLGALIFLPELKGRDDEAFIGYGGPLAGTIASIAVFGLYFLMPGHPLLLQLSYVSAMLNLFNLIPLRPLDGGRVTQITGEWVKYIGMATVLVFVIATKDPGMLLLMILLLGDASLKPGFRFFAGVIFELTMIVLMIFHYGNGSIISEVLDISLSSFLNITYFLSFRRHFEREEDPEEPPAPIGTRLRWMGLYLGLAASLALLMHIQLPLMPKLH